MNENPSSNSSSELTTESIKKIAPSKKIMLISNNSSSYFLGDFISIIDKSQLVVRALVAKLHNNTAGIKIVKIYSEEHWKQLKEKQNIQVLRGDDTSYKVAGSKDGDNDELGSLIDNEDDLFRDTNISEGDIELEDNPKRIIKPDNLIAGNGGTLPVSNSTGTMTLHVSASWARQFSDNIWGEAGVGMSTVASFPSDDIDTVVYNYFGRLKYTIEAPFYTLIQPYIGIQVLTAYSPSAGTGLNLTSETKQEELDLVAGLSQFRPIFGITILKRMVPGWFFRADLGTDVMTAGLCLEF